jgi:hypothetical protein
VVWRGTARTRLAKAARSANRPRQYAHFSRCSRMTLEDSALSSPSKYASSSLSRSRQPIRNLRETLSLCAWNRTAISRSRAREAAAARCQLTRAATEHPLGGSLGCRAATGVNRPRRQSVGLFYSLWSRHSDRRMCETSTTAPTPEHAQGSHWNKRWPEAVLPVGRSAQERPRVATSVRGCPFSPGPESEYQCSRCASRTYRSP